MEDLNPRTETPYNSEARAYTTPVSSLEPEDFYRLIEMALLEDVPAGDVTSDSLFSLEDRSKAFVTSREKGVLCGSIAIKALNEKTGNHLEVEMAMVDGDILEPGSRIAILTGPTRILLRLERILLNFIQYLSGISSQTYHLVQSYPNLHILDTRKTIPGYRKLVKYGVYVGGGWNHRINLSDMAMIKDNHISALGSIQKAVESVRVKNPETKVELEIDRLDQLEEALEASPDIILLDNFSISDMDTAIRMIRETSPSIEIESSGGITPEKLKSLSKYGSIGVSMGYLTHTTRFLDIGLDMETLT